MNGIQHYPEINGVQHSWANLQVVIAGRTVTGITKISYKDSQTMENIYGAGVRPVGRGYGRIECEGAITLHRDEVEAIRNSSDTGRVQDIAPFDIIVQFLPQGGKTIITFIFDSMALWVVCIPVAYVIGHYTGLPITWMFVCVNAAKVVKIFIGLFLLKKGTWKHNIVNDK